MVAKAIEEVLRGRSLAAITREWNELGSTTATGRRWTPTAVRSVPCCAPA